MERVPLGNTGVMVSRIGFGGWTIGGHGWGSVDDRDSTAAVRCAMELGVNFFDTADVYGFGRSEAILAAALGESRKDVMIATKFGVTWDAAGRISHDISPASLTRALHDSLRRLRLDCIPLYQIHWPDGKTPLHSVMESLQRFHEAGKIRFIGVCNVSAEQIEELHRCHPLVSVQMPYNLLNRGIDGAILPLCKRMGITTLTYSPLAHGFLTGRYGSNPGFNAEDIRARSVYFHRANYESTTAVALRVQEMAGRLGRTPAQVAIRWILDRLDRGCVISGIRTPGQIEENVGAMDWHLPPDVERFLLEPLRKDLLPSGADPYS